MDQQTYSVCGKCEEVLYSFISLYSDTIVNGQVLFALQQPAAVTAKCLNFEPWCSREHFLQAYNTSKQAKKAAQKHRNF